MTIQIVHVEKPTGGMRVTCTRLATMSKSLPTCIFISIYYSTVLICLIYSYRLRANFWSTSHIAWRKLRLSKVFLLRGNSLGLTRHIPPFPIYLYSSRLKQHRIKQTASYTSSHDRDLNACIDERNDLIIFMCKTNDRRLKIQIRPECECMHVAARNEKCLAHGTTPFFCHL